MIVSDRWFSYRTARRSRSVISSGPRFGPAPRAVKNDGEKEGGLRISPKQYSGVSSVIRIVTSVDGAVVFCANTTTPQTASRNRNVAAFILGRMLDLILHAVQTCVPSKYCRTEPIFLPNAK